MRIQREFVEIGELLFDGLEAEDRLAVAGCFSQQVHFDAVRRVEADAGEGQLLYRDRRQPGFRALQHLERHIQFRRGSHRLRVEFVAHYVP